MSTIQNQVTTCDECGQVKSPNTDQRMNWIEVVRPWMRLDFCSVKCLALWARKLETNPKQKKGE